MTRPILLVVLLGLVLGCGSEPAGPPATAGAPNVLLVTIDTLRADHLGCYGYFRDTSPTIDALAGESVLFERVYCPMATTLPSHASLLTALNPLEHGILANQEHGGDRFVSRPGARSIAEILKEAGYATGAFVSAAPLKKSTGISAGFDAFVEPEGAMCRAGETVDHALRWIDDHADRRLFAWVHVYDPHWPRKPPSPYLERYRDEPGLDRFLADRRIPDFVGEAPCKLATETRPATNAYDGAIRYVDDQLARLLDAFRSRDLLDRTVVIVTADHGEGLNQHDWPAHGRNWDEQLRVPLLIRFPGSPDDLPERFEPAVSLIDVFPTVLGRLDLPAARAFVAQASGRDVLSGEFQERPLLGLRTGRDCGDDAGPIASWTTRRWKLLHQPKLGDRLFDLGADPHELSDLYAARPEVAEALRADLLAAVEWETGRGKALHEGKPIDEEPLDPRIREQLESLGYIGGGRAVETPGAKGE
jgi:arylsulfatase A-like enzyme